MDELRERGREPVFLHGMWRSGSTFYWSRFRAAPGTCCFYEPLHHGLAKLTSRRIEGAAGETATALRHPPLAEPYYAEYSALVRRRGVELFRSSFAYERFHLGPDDDHPALGRYVQNLLDHAGASGRRPVLGFNRSGGRIGWLKGRFGGFHIQVERDPSAIWGSYAAERAEGNNAFFSMWLRVLEANQDHFLWGALADRLKPRGPLKRRFTKTRADHETRIAAMSNEESYLLVFYAWLAISPRSMASSDLVIDDGLAVEAHYSRELQTRIEESAGIKVDLRELRLCPPRTELPQSVRRRVEAEALRLYPRSAVKHATSSTASLRSQLCSRKLELVSAVS